MTITQELINAERKRFEASAELKYLDFSKTKDAWGKEIYFYTHVEAMWQGWQAAISQHKAMQDGWISVEHRLPSLDGLEVKSLDVLCLFKYGERTDIKIITFAKRIEQEARFESFSNNYITHWMPLPAAPSDSKALVESEPIGEITHVDVLPDDYGDFAGMYRHEFYSKERMPINAELFVTPSDTVKQDAPSDDEKAELLEALKAIVNEGWLGPDSNFENAKRLVEKYEG
jgi:hypothetical protein